MEQRTTGQPGRRWSAVGLGTRQPGRGRGTVDEDVALELLAAALRRWPRG